MIPLNQKWSVYAARIPYQEEEFNNLRSLRQWEPNEKGLYSSKIDELMNEAKKDFEMLSNSKDATIRLTIPLRRLKFMGQFACSRNYYLVTQAGWVRRESDSRTNSNAEFLLDYLLTRA